MSKKELSIILPVKNEKESLPIMIKILKLSLDFSYEVIIVHDDLDDNTIPEAHKLQEQFKEMKISLIHNDYGRGIINAVKKGVESSKYDIILVTVADEIFPIVSIPKMLDLILINDCDLVSGTRYIKGGKTLGGSIVERILSRIANKTFRLLTGFPLTDSTTGIKMFKKKIFQNIELNSKPIGWAFAFELSIKAYLADYKMCEVPYKMINRLFGGSSSFHAFSWIKEYSKWFFWGIFQIIKKKL